MRKRIISLLVILSISISLFPCTLNVQGATGGVQQNIDQIKAVYPNSYKYFTASGKDNFVESIEVVPGTEPAFIENSKGRWEPRWDSETEMLVQFFLYNCGSILHDTEIQINYKDGTTKVANVGSYVDGYYIDYEHNQYSYPWKIGKDNHITVTYHGCSTDVPVTIIESPVESIEVVPGTEPILFEKSAGFWEDGDFFYYYDYNKIIIQINYKDGTTKVANVGNYVDNYLIDYYGDTRWMLGNNNHVTVTYLGCSVDVPVTIIESPVESIEIISIDTLYENTNGLDGEGGWWFYDLTSLNAEVLIRYKDGSSQKSKLHNYINGYKVDFYEEQYKNRFVLGDDNFFKITYMGKEVEARVKIIENNIKTVEIIKQPDKTQYIYEDLRGMVIRLTYMDGSTKDVKIDKIEIKQYCHGKSFGFFFVADIDDPNIKISMYPNHDENDSYILYVNGIEHKLDFEKTTELLIKSFSVSDPDIEKIESLRLVYKDGSTETIQIEEKIPVSVSFDSDPSDKYFIKTKYGLLFYECFVSDYGDQLEYSIRLFGKTITVRTDKPDIPEKSATFETAQVSLSDSLKLTVGASCENISNPKMRFTLDGISRTVVGTTDSNGKYYFEFPGITSEYMNSLIDIEILDGDNVLSSKQYSIRDYCNTLFKASPESLGISEEKFASMKVMLADMLEYGAMSQLYRNMNVDDMANKLDWVSKNKSNTLTQPDSDLSIVKESSSQEDIILAATIHLADDVKQKFVFKAKEADRVVICVDSNENSQITYLVKDAKKRSDGKYEIETMGLCPDHFGDIYDVKLCKGNMVLEEIHYSVNSYISAMWGSNDAKLSALIKALYNFSLSTKLYKNI